MPSLIELTKKFAFKPHYDRDRQIREITKCAEAFVKAMDSSDDEEESMIDEFFKDNLVRYARDEEEEEDEPMIIVPVLPIVPSQKRKLTLSKENNSHTSTASHTNAAQKANDTTTAGSSTITSNTTSSKKRGSEHLDSSPDEQKRKMLKTNPVQTELHKGSFYTTGIPHAALDTNEQAPTTEKQETDPVRLAMATTVELLSDESKKDPMLVAEYANEIFEHLYDTEIPHEIDTSYADGQQTEITWKMRDVLIDWIIEVHYLFGLQHETLYLSVNIIDRFLSHRTISVSKLQLVGITAVYIATKFEESHCPNLKDFLFMVDNAFKRDDVLKAEKLILDAIDFRLCFANPIDFYRRICAEDKRCDLHCQLLAMYFMEVGCVNHAMLGIRPSKLAAASLWLSKKMLRKGSWTAQLTKASGYSSDDLREVVLQLLNFLAQPSVPESLFRKWSGVSHSKASIFVRDWVNRYYVVT
ncbi:MAG: cyclin-like protein [Benjaminiella poitrasii]|nr:MAG: cyclin-like protein [Benjaminiella poitrasii]